MPLGLLLCQLGRPFITVGQFDEGRVALFNSDVSALGAKLAALKSEENSLRDGFMGKMLELNADIRKFQEFVASSSNMEKSAHATLTGGPLTTQKQDVEQARLVLENKLAQMIMHTDQEEQQYKVEKDMHAQVQEELSNLKRKAMLMESVMKESMELQEHRLRLGQKAIFHLEGGITWKES